MIRTLIARMFGFVEPSPVIAPVNLLPQRISGEAIARSRNLVDPDNLPQIDRYMPPAGVLPKDRATSDVLAMDTTDYSYLNEAYSGTYFRGYPYLAMLAQRPEYRKMSETIAKEMTRRWIKIVATGDDDKSDKIAQLEKAMTKYKVRKLFRKAAQNDGLFGRGQIFVDVAKPGTKVSSRDDHDELKTILLRDKAKVTKGSLMGFVSIEPVWTYPSSYNADDPLSSNYYKPSAWYVMGKEVHSSRMLTFVSREVPDMLKPAYNFGGVSMSQQAETYVDNWTRTRDSVSDLVHAFSTSGILTDMGTALTGGNGNDLFDRAALFNNMRDNRGLFVLNKETEEFFQFNTPLSGLSELQAQAQEQQSSVSCIPLVKLLGITPSGLNASSDGEIRVFYDHIKSEQDVMFREPLEQVLEIIQLSEFGQIDPDIGIEFVPLWESNEVEQSTIRKTDADTDAVLIDAGVIAPDEARQRLADDPSSGYHSIEVNAAIDDTDDEDDDE